MPEAVDAVNVVNAPSARPKKSYFKTMVVIMLGCLAVLAVKYTPTAAAAPAPPSEIITELAVTTGYPEAI